MKLTIKDGRDHFYTFDTNRILLLTATDEDMINQVEFSTEENGEEVSWTSEVLTGSDGVKYVQVPNEFLNGEYSRLVCYYVALDSSGEFTRQKEIFRIRARQEPQDYYLTYSERVTFASIKALTEQYKATTKQYMDTTEGFKDNAGRSAELASKYAENNEDVAVEPGKYSAKHWSIKAEAAKETAVQKATEAGTSEVNSKTYMESAQSAKQDAETAKNAANTILEQVQSKGTEITNFVATSKTEIETQKNESVNAVKSVYQTDLNELKGDLTKSSICSDNNVNSIFDNLKSILNKQDIAIKKYPIVEQGRFSSGVDIESNVRCRTDYIKHDDFWKWTIKNDNTKSQFNICAYDENKKFLLESGYVSLSEYLISTQTFDVAYIRILFCAVDEVSPITPKECDLYFTKTEPYPVDNTNTVIHVRPNTSIYSILQGVKYAYSIGAKKVVVEAGTYDILQEYKSIYGNDYFDNYNGYITSDKFDRGIWLEDIEIVFSQGALVIADYTGNNNAVKVNFTPFSCGNNVIIDGLTLYARELRYGIHPDFNSGDDVSYMIIKNCDIDFYRTLSEGKWLQCIGAGLGKHVKWEISNCIFRTPSTDAWGDCVRIHNNSDADAQSEIIIHNCYIYGIGRFGIYNYGSSTKMSKCLISGCSWETDPLIANESGYTGEPNIETVLFCNEKRSS